MALTLLDLSAARATVPTTKRSADPMGSGATAVSTIGAFQAARINRLTGDWASWSRSADQELFTDGRILRARSRQLAINNPLAARYLQLLRQNVVGPEGILFASKIEASPKAITRRQADTANATIEAAWTDWCKLGNCTADGKQSFVEMLNGVVECLGREGEVVLRKVYGPQYKHGFSVQVLDPDQLDDTLMQLRPSPGGNQVRLGVEVNPQGKPTAYHLYDGNPYETYTATVSRKRVPADQILHVYIQHRPGQSRGYPWIAPAMFDLKMLDGYLEAEVLAARIHANQCLLLESDLGDGYTGAGDGPDGEGYQNAGGSAQMNMEPGSITQLPPGLKPYAFTPQHPMTAFPAFLKSVIRFIASGLGVAYTTLSNDLEGVSYSSARVGMLDERDHWSTLQRFVIDHICTPIFENWLRSALLTGALPGVPLNFDLVNHGKWEGRSWDWVDPHKDAQGQVLALENGLTTHTKVLAEQGMDFEATMKQLAKEKALLNELGLKLGTDTQGKADAEINSGEPFAVPNPGTQAADSGGGDGGTKPGNTP